MGERNTEIGSYLRERKRRNVRPLIFPFLLLFSTTQFFNYVTQRMRKEFGVSLIYRWPIDTATHQCKPNRQWERKGGKKKCDREMRAKQKKGAKVSTCMVIFSSGGGSGRGYFQCLYSRALRAGLCVGFKSTPSVLRILLACACNTHTRPSQRRDQSVMHDWLFHRQWLSNTK